MYTILLRVWENGHSYILLVRVSTGKLFIEKNLAMAIKITNAFINDS
jgi:hypothetical protein